jgi:ribosomal protein S18 acetylase RimI-like enzyme
MLPRLFFDHFPETSFVAEADDGGIAGFLVGFLSQASDDEAYIHFVGVDPAWRGRGVGGALYRRFFEAVVGSGRTVVRCVTSPANVDSLAFHEAMGFSVEDVVEGYQRPGEDRVLLVKHLA